MKLGLIQMNPTIGALGSNLSKLIAAVSQAAERGASLVVCPELTLCGYPPRDLLLQRAFLSALAAAESRLLTEIPADITLVYGSVGGGKTTPRPLRQSEDPAAPLGNDVIVARGGVELKRGRKCLLPNYDVFDEARYFSPAGQLTSFEHEGLVFKLSVCEDAWGSSEAQALRYAEDPFAAPQSSPADIILNISASPFYANKNTERRHIFSELAKAQNTPLVFVNQVGANDELIFDGRSAVYQASGALHLEAASFEEDIVVFDLAELSSEARRPINHTDNNDIEEIYRALCLGVADYTRKCGFKHALLGLSGGIDSALVACIARDALGADRVKGIAMPSRYSSEGSIIDARELAQNLGIEFEVLPIDPLYASFLKELEGPMRSWQGPMEGDTTFENLQARIRGTLLMAHSNRTGSLVLTTGNKSEVAVGYCTLYGDMAGGLAVLSDVYKTQVYRMANWLNREGIRIPLSTIEKPPSAELRDGQTDQDSLPPYPELDRILELTIERGMSRAELLGEGFEPGMLDQVLRLLRISEYKRRQAAPGLIVSRKAFGVGRRYPVAQRFSEPV